MTISEEVVTDIGLLRTITRFGNDQAIELARESTPGPLGSYAQISEQTPSVADDGTTLFLARFTGRGIAAANDTALLRALPGGDVEVVQREGAAAPGYGPGVVFDDMMAFLAQTLPSITNSRTTLLLASVRGPGINASNDRGAWVVSDEGDTELLVREGQWLSIDGEPLRQVEHVVIGVGNGTNSGRRPSINERGDVAMALAFTNGDNAIVVAQTMPECTGDLNLDGTVDASDLAILLGAWGEFGPVGTGGDVDLDGDTDGQDLGTLLGAWGPCGS